MSDDTLDPNIRLEATITIGKMMILIRKRLNLLIMFSLISSFFEAVNLIGGEAGLNKTVKNNSIDNSKMLASFCAETNDYYLTLKTNLNQYQYLILKAVLCLLCFNQYNRELEQNTLTRPKPMYFTIQDKF